MQKLNKKSIFSRLMIGFKKGLSVPNLPSHIIQLNNKPIIRILRVLGGLSTLLILTHRLELLGDGFLYLCALITCAVLTLLFGLYHIFLTYHRITHIIKVLKSDELDVRNSPLDKLSSIAARIIMCSKGFCDTAAPVGVVIGGMASIDEIRKAKGLEPIFLPKLADWIFEDTEFTKKIKQMRYDEACLSRTGKELDAYKVEHGIVDSFEKDGVISKSEAKTWREQINRNESLCNNESKELKSKILSSLEQLNQIRSNKK